MYISGSLFLLLKFVAHISADACPASSSSTQTISTDTTITSGNTVTVYRGVPFTTVTYDASCFTTISETTYEPMGSSGFTSTISDMNAFTETILFAYSVTTTTTFKFINSASSRYTSTVSQNANTAGTVVVGVPKTTTTTTIPAAEFTNGACYNDTTGARVLAYNFTQVDPAYPTQSTTPEFCSNFCAEHDFVYSGVEYSYQCFCGNVTRRYISGQVTDPMYFSTGFDVDNYAVVPPYEHCTRACSGNKTELCGGFGALIVQFATLTGLATSTSSAATTATT